MTARGTRAIERHLGDWARARLPATLAELVMFVLKQGWAALFGFLMLAGLLVTRALWQPDWPLARYDALVLYALALQVAFLWARLETLAEARVILLFHLTGTAMEIFKIHMGSWAYPEPGLLKLWGVPLFSGFMYASVGSYMARAIRIFEMRFAPFPPMWQVQALALAIYLNFFTHHCPARPAAGAVRADAAGLLAAPGSGSTSTGRRAGCRCRWRPCCRRCSCGWPRMSARFTGTWIYARHAGWHMAGLAEDGQLVSIALCCLRDRHPGGHAKYCRRFRCAPRRGMPGRRKRNRHETRYLHTMVRVLDLEKSMAFYELLGLKETRRIETKRAATRWSSWRRRGSRNARSN